MLVGVWHVNAAATGTVTGHSVSIRTVCWQCHMMEYLENSDCVAIRIGTPSDPDNVLGHEVILLSNLDTVCKMQHYLEVESTFNKYCTQF